MLFELFKLSLIIAMVYIYSTYRFLFSALSLWGLHGCALLE